MALSWNLVKLIAVLQTSYPSNSTSTNTSPPTMPRGNAAIAKVHYKGSTDDFIVFVDSVEDLKAWKEDKSIPLAQVVGSFKIMVTDK